MFTVYTELNSGLHSFSPFSLSDRLTISALLLFALLGFFLVVCLWLGNERGMLLL